MDHFLKELKVKFNLRFSPKFCGLVLRCMGNLWVLYCDTVCFCDCLWYPDEESSGSEIDPDVQSEVEFEDERSVNSENDNLLDGYLSDSGSDTSEHSDVTEQTSCHTQPYVPPHLQPHTNKLKLRKSINGLINRYCAII